MWRFWKQRIALLALAAAVGLWCVSATLAAKPGGGAAASASAEASARAGVPRAADSGD